MVTGLHVRSRNLGLALIVAAMLLVTSVYAPICLENALGLEIRQHRPCRAYV